jgi:hypothetical protein
MTTLTQTSARGAGMTGEEKFVCAVPAPVFAKQES